MLAARMRLADPGGEHLVAREIIIAYAQAVARLARIHGIGAEVESVVHLGERAGGQQSF